MAPADETSVDTLPEPESKTKLSLGLCIKVNLIALCISGIIIAALEWNAGVHKDPSFSVKLTDVHGNLNPAHSPVIRPDFQLTLHIDNNQIDRTCKEEIAVTVFYGDMVVGWADAVPDFCVDKWSSAEVNISLSHTDVLLTDGLRRRLASELRAGELEFDVEMRMVIIPEGFDWECHECKSRQSFLFCTAKPGQDYAPCTTFLLM